MQYIAAVTIRFCDEKALQLSIYASDIRVLNLLE
jgi:hypothetical protein